MSYREVPGFAPEGLLRRPGALSHHTIIEYSTYNVLRIPATTQMYAYIDGDCSVGMGVYFCYVLFDNRWQISIPVIESIVEYPNDIFRIDFGAAGCSTTYDVL